MPQTLAHLMASPHGDDIVFVKLEAKQYGTSQVLAPLVNQGELERVS